MAINLAEKYSDKIDERFVLASVTAAAVNNNYDFSGTKTVKVYSIPTIEMNDYERTGTTRYGTPSELADSLQELTMKKDRSFTFTIDRGNYEDQMKMKSAGEALKRQISEVVVPEIDIYRISTMAAGAGTTSSATAITKANAYDAFLDGVNALTEAKAPLGGRIAYITPAFFKAIRQDESFTKATEIAQNQLINGQIGTIEGIKLIQVPTAYMPSNTAFIITHPIAVCSPIKLAEYKVHDNPPGISGWLAEGRVYYDAFVLENKKGAIYVHKTA